MPMVPGDYQEMTGCPLYMLLPVYMLQPALKVGPFKTGCLFYNWLTHFKTSWLILLCKFYLAHFKTGQTSMQPILK